MELQNLLQNAFNLYADNTAIEVENHSITYAKLRNQSQGLLKFLKIQKKEMRQIISLFLAIVS